MTGGISKCLLSADIKAEVGDIAVLHDVVFSFEALEAFFGGGGK
jgi:hypothetical protein